MTDGEKQSWMSIVQTRTGLMNFIKILPVCYFIIYVITLIAFTNSTRIRTSMLVDAFENSMFFMGYVAIFSILISFIEIKGHRRFLKSAGLSIFVLFFTVIGAKGFEIPRFYEYLKFFFLYGFFLVGVFGAMSLFIVEWIERRRGI